MKLPGLIDVHVHLRSPGGEHKEGFHNGTAAALAGGFTLLMAMPNTQPPLTTLSAWRIAQENASSNSLCDVFMYAGASREHIQDLPALSQHAPALKLYMDETYGSLKVDELSTLVRVFEIWPAHKPLAVHAEGRSVANAIALATVFNRPVHICHVSRKSEIELIARAKLRGLPVTCEVAPHHLFLTREDETRLGALGIMRPPLGDAEDVTTLWAHIDSTIDIIASDHAPHLLSEKQSANPPFGVPGLESTLPLMLTAVHQNKISMSRVIELLYTNPKKIFDLPEQPDTWIEIDPDAHYTFPGHTLYTRCGWSPYSGKPVIGRISRVVYHGKEVVKDGQLINH